MCLIEDNANYKVQLCEECPPRHPPHEPRCKMSLDSWPETDASTRIRRHHVFALVPVRGA